MSKPVITLTTDFGLYDHYVGVLKGVILNINPDINIIDLSHEINPFDIVEAAFKIECAYRYFPTRSIHLVVIDPGVGSDRRAICVTGENHYFIAPDNGVLSWIMNTANISRVYEINAAHYFLEKVSKTFHARDIFAPCAAYLSRTMDASTLGDEITDYKKFKLPEAEKVGDKTFTGKIISIDRFGNCISNIHEELLESVLEEADNSKFQINLGKIAISGLSDSYDASEKGKPLAIFGNAGYLEIALNKGSAARELKIRKNMDITITL